MTYPLGTTLIFTTKSAMALLKEHGISHTWVEYYTERRGWKQGGFNLTKAKAIRIVLDTEEKQNWFMPKVGDLVEIKWGGVRYIKMMNEHSRIKGEKRLGFLFKTHSNQTTPFWINSAEVEKIIQRNGLAFPQPQQVMPSEEKL